jgi:hypothetical protein
VKSSLGGQLRRAELYAYDSTGKRIPKLERGSGVMPVKESRSYYDDPNAGGEDEAAIEDGGLRARFDTLTADERRCLQLHEARGRELDGLLPPDVLRTLLGPGGPRVREEKLAAPRREEESLVAAGWTLVKRDGRTSHLVKNYPAMLGYEQISRVTGLTINQVRARVLSAHRKLRTR